MKWYEKVAEAGTKSVKGGILFIILSMPEQLKFLNMADNMACFKISLQITKKGTYRLQLC